MNIFNVGENVRYKENLGMVIDVYVEGSNTKYLVELRNGEVKSLFAKDLELA